MKDQPLAMRMQYHLRQSLTLFQQVRTSMKKPQRMQAWGWRTLLGGWGVRAGPQPVNGLARYGVPPPA
jgi:hypothetical protein